ncbi:hypothetical protein CHS0354_012763 [Potamilus streckersoni]|uniref:Uncharacterized protein n=1 Tax=Potamilus streckersoni TaxID=2493646 RepID=A0AAE0RV97_9BIVA|nr:hypothetical protein CHS0354_012763 [Potamilus streckersoni]
MLMMATAKIDQEDGPCCPICLEQFNIPKQLPCAHSFCEKCLQSHITTEATKCKTLRCIQCPICRNSTSPSIKDRPTSEWASLFPTNIVLQSVLATKSKVDRMCDACNLEGVSVPAGGFCVVCKEVMCADCLKFHRKQKMLKDHAILALDELACNPENVLKLAEGFTCSEHHGEDIKYYCEDHKVPCCGTCFFQDHKICFKVIDLKEELPTLLRKCMPEEIIANMKNIEMHLKKFVEINEICVNNLQPQVARMTDQIREIKKKINIILYELEERVRTEGNRIYKEEVIRKQEENHQCLSIIHAVKNSHYLFEAVNKYGSNLQKFLMAEKMKSQLHSYCNLVGEKYEKTETMTFEVNFAHSIQSILSLSLPELGTVATTAIYNTLPLIYLRRPAKNYQVEKVDVIDLQVPIGNNPCYFDITFLPDDKLMLADDNNQCILLSSAYQFITSYSLPGKPGNICGLEDQEVAVSLLNQNKILILSVVGDVFTPVRRIVTNYNCNGIAAAGNGEMVVNGYCNNNKSQWFLVTKKGDVKYLHQYDSQNYKDNYVALNNMKTRVYVSVYNMNSLLCFDMDGRKQFTYSPDNLRGPSGVAVDRHDNIYVIGHISGNIHQLCTDGSVFQVITSGVPKCPLAICIHKSKDMLVITNTSNRTKLHSYQLKLI